MNSPFVPVFFYGIFMESVPLCNSRRKHYIILFGCLLTISLSIAALVEFPTPGGLVAALTSSYFCMAVIQTIVDGMLVVELRKDALHGSDDLQTYSWCCLSIGGIFANLGAGAIGQWSKYRYSYMIPGSLSICITIIACFISKDLDGDAKQIRDMSFCRRLKFNFALIKQGLKFKQLNRTFIFFMLIGFMTPSFKDFMDYFYNFDSFKDGSVEMVMFSGILGATIIYHTCLSKMQIRTLQVVAACSNILNATLNLLLVLGITFGLSRYWFVII